MPQKSDIDMVFTNDNDNGYIEMPVSFFYEQIILKEYRYKRNYEDVYTYTSAKMSKLFNIPHVTMIVAQLPLKSDNDACKYIEYKHSRIRAKDLSLLVSLLNLRFQLSSEIFDELSDIEHLLKIDNACNIANIRAMFRNSKIRQEPIEIKDKDLELIVNWCKSNGYPFSLDSKFFLLNKGKKINIRHTLLMQNKLDQHKVKRYYLVKSLIDTNCEVGFWVWEFLRKLQIIYYAFILYNHICEKDLDHLDIRENVPIKYDAKTCKKLLQQIYKTVNLKGILDFEKYENNDLGRLTGYETDNIFDLAIYSLFIYMSDFQQTLKRCPLCNNFFKPKSMRQKYCNSSLCYPQLAYKRKKALQKKEKQQSTHN